MSDPATWRAINDLRARIGRLESADRAVDSFAVVYRCGAAPSIPSSTGDTLIDFETSVYDPAGLVATGASWAYTCPATGYYLVSAAVLFDSAAAWADGERAQLTIYLGGASAIRLDRRDNYPTNTFARVAGENVVSCAAGDTLDVRISQNSGSAILLNA
jgi:hypothetical protein